MPDRVTEYLNLRAKHPRFIYESFSVSQEATQVHFGFKFLLEPNIRFEPKLTIECPAERFLADSLLQNLAFHLGLIEMVSYWKAACSPEIVIRAGSLNLAQVKWWKEVFFHGLSEFFYLNGLSPSLVDFVDLKTEGPVYPSGQVDFQSGNLIPVGGGKDSLVTLDLLRAEQEANLLFFLNPTKAQWGSAEVMGYSRQQIVLAERKIDPLLLQLNREGYLNGHTPFSALLGFISVAAAAFFGRQRVMLSNERSADESTIPGTLINHQWSKSGIFETMFHDYVQTSLIPGMQYVSVLRTWSELQIARHFTLIPNKPGLKVFRSCNVGQKTDSWCGTCPKCLFVNIILAPFLQREEVREIFSGKEPLNQASLSPIFQQLIGASPTKPFECIGSVEEVRAALSMVSRMEDQPALVHQFSEKFSHWVQSPEEVDAILNHPRKMDFSPLP